MVTSATTISRLGSRRVVLGACLAVFLASLLQSGEAEAHHGGHGAYDAGRPVYLEGTVRSASYGYPHALIDLEVATDVVVPNEVEGAEGLRGYESWEALSPADGGLHELLLPPDLTGEVGSLPDRPEAGDELAAIAYRECETGELRVQLLSFGGEAFSYDGTITNIVDGCAGRAGAQGEDPADRAEGESVGDAGSDSAAAEPRSEEAAPTGLPSSALFGGAAALAVGGVAGFVAFRGRRYGRGPSEGE